MTTYPVDNYEQGWLGWYTYTQLVYMAGLMPEEAGDYDSDSPQATFITGYDTSTYPDELESLIVGLWEQYQEDCEEEERQPDVAEYVDKVCEDYDYQLLHTWLRVTNLHIEDDKEVDDFGRECVRATIQERLEDRQKYSQANRLKPVIFKEQKTREESQLTQTPSTPQELFQLNQKKELTAEDVLAVLDELNPSQTAMTVHLLLKRLTTFHYNICEGISNGEVDQPLEVWLSDATHCSNALQTFSNLSDFNN